MENEKVEGGNVSSNENIQQATSPKSASSRKTVLIIVGTVFGVVVVFLTAFIGWGFYLNNQDKKSGGVSLENNKNMNTSITEKISFPVADYKDFALSDTTDSLDPKIAQPKLTEYGMQHLEIVQKNDGYATVGANLLATKISVPLGWESRGGFDPFDKIFFYPKGAQQAEGGLPSSYIALKILDSQGLGVSDFDSVQQAVTKMMKETGDPAYENMNVISDPDKNIFVYEVRGIKNVVTGKPIGAMDIYIKDPTPGSTLWADLQLSVPDEQFEKFKGLEGLMYNSLEINWSDLAQIVAQTR